MIFFFYFLKCSNLSLNSLFRYYCYFVITVEINIIAIIFILAQISVIDDEYRWAGTCDPKIVITTSRDPSSKLKVFVKVN